MVYGAILYISMTGDLLHINYSLWVFWLDKLDYGCYIILTRCCNTWIFSPKLHYFVNSIRKQGNILLPVE